MAADEEDYLDLVIAGELVAQWLEVIATSNRIERVTEAAEKLREGIERSEAYAEEAMEEGATEMLEEVLKRPKEEWGSVFSDIERILAKLNDYTEQYGTVSGLKYGDYEIRIRQGALHDGLGARIWKVAHLLNKCLAAHPEWLQNKRILELGSGCGSTGILAAVMAPTSQVTLTDCVPSVLENLRQCCRLNQPKSNPSQELQCVIEQMNDDSLEALSCEEGTDDVFIASSAWEIANMTVRFLEWTSNAISSGTSNGSLREPMPPSLPTDAKFDVVLGSEVLYETDHGAAVASVIQERLAPGGRCLLAGAVRETEVFASFCTQCAGLDLRVQQHTCTTAASNGIDVTDYEGGVVFLAVDHVTSPCWAENALDAI